jgi:aminoglycoside phosphotransferase (APT) family kinase protein
MRTTGDPLGSGRSADVYAIDDAWVLRRYRHVADVASEAALMRYLYGRGYPVPQIRPDHPAGLVLQSGTDLVMRRLSGPTMAQAMLAGAMPAAEGGTTLARLLRQLHGLPARGSRTLEARILHLDLHPENVMLTADGPVVIDWSNAEEGPPGLDWAMSALILAQAALGSPPEVAVGIGEGLAALLGDAGDEVDALAHLPQAAARRAANPGLSRLEIARLDEAVAMVRAAAG